MADSQIEANQPVEQQKPEDQGVEQQNQADSQKEQRPDVFTAFKGQTGSLPKHACAGWASDKQLASLADLPAPPPGDYQADMMYRQAMVQMQAVYSLSQIERSLYFMEARQDATAASDDDVWRHRSELYHAFLASKNTKEKAASLAESRQYNRDIWKARAKGTALYSCCACMSFVGEATGHVWWQLTQ